MQNASNNAALDALKDQGFEIGESAIQDGQVLVRIRTRDDSALVETGRDLWELAAGRLTLGEIAHRPLATNNSDKSAKYCASELTAAQTNVIVKKLIPEFSR